MREKLAKTRIMNNIGLKMLALLIAVLTWLIVVNVDDPINTKVYAGVPVEVINADVVTENNRTYQIVDNTEEVTVTIRARRSVLTKIRLDDIVAYADMKELTLGTQVPIEVKVEKFGGKIEQVTSKPGNLQVAIDEEAKATFPITPTATGSVREGYSIKTLNADPVQITFRGPQQQIGSINRVCALVDVSGLSETSLLDAKLILYDSYENVIDQTMIENNLGKDGVTVEVVMNQMKKVPVIVDTSMISTRYGYSIGEVKVAPSEVKIVGTKENLQEVNQIQIPAEVLETYGLEQTKEITFDILPFLPDTVRLQDENANMIVVTISVEKPGTKSYQISTGSINVENLNQNLELEYDSYVDFEIQVRGPERALNTISFAQRVKMNLEGYDKPGIYEIPVTIDLPEGCSLVNPVYLEITLEDASEQ